MKNIYILLTRSRTILSRLIHLATNDTYTHASIAWDDELTTLCSFARRHTSLPLPAGKSLFSPKNKKWLRTPMGTEPFLPYSLRKTDGW